MWFDAIGRRQQPLAGGGKFSDCPVRTGSCSMLFSSAPDCNASFSACASAASAEAGLRRHGPAARPRPDERRVCARTWPALSEPLTLALFRAWFIVYAVTEG